MVDLIRLAAILEVLKKINSILNNRFFIFCEVIQSYFVYVDLSFKLAVK